MRPTNLDAQSLDTSGKIEAFLDPGSFVEVGASSQGRRRAASERDTVIAGSGTVHGRPVFVFSQVGASGHGAIGSAQAGKICRLLDLALAAGAPVVGLFGSGSLDLREGVGALAAYGEILDRNVACSGVIPQISAMMGQAVGGLTFSPGLSDLVFMVQDSSSMFLLTPDAIEAVTGERVDIDTLGGAESHGTASGIAHVVAADDVDCLERIRYLLTYLPSNNAESPPSFLPTDDPKRPCDGLRSLIPDSTKLPYDMEAAIIEILDDAEFFELQPHWARNMIIGLGRLDGHTVGIVANQPSVLAGTLDIASSIKGARFVRFCDAFNIPILTILDVPGFLPGVSQEFGGIIRHGAKLVYAFAEATVPRITLVARKAYGGAYIVMNSRHIRADLSFAWPSAEIAVMGAEGASRVIHRKEIARAHRPVERSLELIEDYRQRFSTPYLAAERGYVDDVINPIDTRRELIQGFEMLRTKREVLPARKHDNMVL